MSKLCGCLLLFFINFNVACASKFPKVDKDIAEYDKAVEKQKSDFSKIEKNLKDIQWIQMKLDNMFKIDQYMRNYAATPFKNKYSKSEEAEFFKQFNPRFESIDMKNTSDLKELLEIYDWFKISVFGAKADNQAWLIVQHADKDIDFQKKMLIVLEKLWPLGETKPSNYAYLYDRVISSQMDMSKSAPQRYGTQGRCVGPGKWEPWPIEDETHVDDRRKSVGLGSMEEYKKMFLDICH